MVSRILSSIVRTVQRSRLVRPEMRRRMLNAIGANIAPGAVIEASCILGSADIHMGPDSKINAFAFYDGYAPLIILAGARIAVRATILTQSHRIAPDPRRRSTAELLFQAPVIVGAGAWVGAGAMLLPGASIGAGCVIGAGGVVTGRTEPNGLYVNSAAAGGGAVRARWVRQLPEGIAL